MFNKFCKATIKVTEIVVIFCLGLNSNVINLNNYKYQLQHSLIKAFHSETNIVTVFLTTITTIRLDFTTLTLTMIIATKYKQSFIIVEALYCYYGVHSLLYTKFC